MSHLFSIGLLLLLSLGSPQPAVAQESSKTEKVIALAPLASVGGGPAAHLRKLTTLVEHGLASLPNTTLIRSKASREASYAAQEPKLRACDGEVHCLASLGKLLNAQIVIYAEASDLGNSQVVYLKAVDVSSGAEISSTTLEINGEIDKQYASREAMTKLLAKDRHIGRLRVTTNVAGAKIFLDGHLVRAGGEEGAIEVSVGSHALRVTHPEHRDLVRFVDVYFEKTSEISAKLAMLPGLHRKLLAEGALEAVLKPEANFVQVRPLPWYYRWYSIAGGATAIAVTSALLYSLNGTVQSYDASRNL